MKPHSLLPLSLLALVLSGAVAGAAEAAAPETAPPGPAVTSAPPAMVAAPAVAPAVPGTNREPVNPALAAAVKELAATGVMDFAAFRVIVTNSIFDPNRRPGRGPTTVIEENPGPRIRSDWFTLKGTMSYEDRAYAFFEGTSREYTGGFKPADSIAGYKITTIANDHIDLAAAAADKPIELRIGMQLRRTGSGPWILMASPDLGESADSVAGGGSGSSSSPAADSGGSVGSSSGSSGGSAEEAMKRMIARRLKESGQ